VKRAFTLIELMVSIAILSIIMIFLYKSYSELNKSNKIYANEVKKIKKLELIKKTVYLDISLAMAKSIKILKQDKDEDVVFFQTKHSIHRRINPYIAYIVNNKKLYRLESIKEFKEYPLDSMHGFDVDFLGDIDSFRVYSSKVPTKDLYLVNINFKKEEEVLLKVKVLDEY
jgi:prepilin-type N-terminal cleavage/methylation domain-containing protein